MQGAVLVFDRPLEALLGEFERANIVSFEYKRRRHYAPREAQRSLLLLALFDKVVLPNDSDTLDRFSIVSGRLDGVVEMTPMTADMRERFPQTDAFERAAEVYSAARPVLPLIANYLVGAGVAFPADMARMLHKRRRESWSSFSGSSTLYSISMAKASTRRG